MYLQITTKCNMRCPHCAMSCTAKGEHMNFDNFLLALRFMDKRGDEYICIGGGEPTLHPRFFDILDRCLNSFTHTWFATNGSKIRSMKRLAKMLDHMDDIDYEPHLSVALSLDYWHSPIDPWVVDYWSRRSRQSGKFYEIRDVIEPIKVGRAAVTGVGMRAGCACTELFITPAGYIKPCGCPDAPIVGNICSGIEEKWEHKLNFDDGYNYSGCSHDIGRKDFP